MLIIDALGLEPVDSFITRKKVQKLIYLLREFGFPGLAEYRYAWYIHGPYSPLLTRDITDFLEQLRVSAKR